MAKLKDLFSRMLRGGFFLFKVELLMWGLFLLLAAIASAVKSVI